MAFSGPYTKKKLAVSHMVIEQTKGNLRNDNFVLLSKFLTRKMKKIIYLKAAVIK